VSTGARRAIVGPGNDVRTRHAVGSILTLVSIAPVVACAARAPADASWSRCEGRRIVVVSNYWDRQVDVYASTGGIIGIVDPGRSEEFVLPGAASYAYPRASYRGRTQRVPRTVVRFRYRCD
jgi:hypothetical protein